MLVELLSEQKTMAPLVVLSAEVRLTALHAVRSVGGPSIRALVNASVAARSRHGARGKLKVEGWETCSKVLPAKYGGVDNCRPRGAGGVVDGRGMVYEYTRYQVPRYQATRYQVRLNQVPGKLYLVPCIRQVNYTWYLLFM